MQRHGLRQAGLLDARSGDADSRLERGQTVVGGLFPTPLVSARLAGHSALDEALTATVLARRDVERGVTVSNVGGWHSAEFLSWCGPAGHAVIEAAHEIVDRMTLMEVGGDVVPADVAWRVAAWANVSGRGDAHRPHGHPGAYWSGVYWVDADPSNGGLLEFADPRGILPGMVAPHLRVAVQDCLGAGRGEQVVPEPGLIVVFPSWLIHSVTAYGGERPRISIAFNFGL